MNRTAVVSLMLLALLAGAAAAAPPVAPVGARRVLWTEGVKNAYPHWSRDGARILFQSNRTGTWQVYVMDRDGSHQTQLTHGDSNNNFPDWSPDDRSIAFVSDRDGNEEVYVMRFDGGGPRNLSGSPARDIHPYWSADGRSILFSSTRDGDRFQIYEVRPDGTDLRRLVTSEDDDTCARVSPAGDRIVYLTNITGGADDVVVRDRDGSHPRNVTHDAPADGWPTWTPDGRHIVFSSQRDGAFALYEMASDGTGARRITAPPSPYYDGRASVSRDGRYLVFNREHDDTIGIMVVELR